MLNDMESRPTLTFTTTAQRFMVRRFSGREALNQLYQFEIDVAGPALELQQSLHQPALLALTAQAMIHGTIHSASRYYEGPQHVGYRLMLGPHLRVLDQPRRRRIWQQSSVPQILRCLLQEHQLPEDSYRFDLPHGVYPPRELCIQYAESDLQLLHRLCEEEGIHFHFEHHPQQHVLVFAEDSGSFIRQPLETRFDPGAAHGHPPVIQQLTQSLGRPHDVLHPTLRRTDFHGAPFTLDEAANQSHCAAPPSGARLSPAQAHQNQLGRRELERLRCLDQHIDGRSTDAAMSTGRILQVSGHPRASLNDQWLLYELQHHFQMPEDGHTAAYHNRFKAIPWSTEFRPPFKAAKPCINGLQIGRVIGPARLDDNNRLQVQLWPTHPDGHAGQGVWLPVIHSGSGQANLPKAGSDVHVSFLEGDPDRPVLCATDTYACAGEEPQSISLAANGNVLHINPNSITLSGPMLDGLPAGASEPAVTDEANPAPEQPWRSEIYLFERPPATSDRLADTPWYIVRMPDSGITRAGSLEQKDVLIHGTSSEHGELALSVQQKTRLASEFARTPEQLCLMYSGHCVLLAEYVRQHWDSRQRLALIECARSAERHQRCAENHLLFEWLLPPSGKAT
ncbi:type VI secretion system Vgr family protein [Pseudomonas fluorescens]|uniref:type VI secretion system Vgr family protein n=1 Tax=Pseudomonas fluorescens TaxID=294 RepID=UPI003F9A1D25